MFGVDGVLPPNFNNERNAWNMAHNRAKVHTMLLRLLSGESPAQRRDRETVMEAFERSVARNLIVLTRSLTKPTFYGLYAVDPSTIWPHKIIGRGPPTFRAEQVAHWLKYDLGSRLMQSVITDAYFLSIDCVILKDQHLLGHNHFDTEPVEVEVEDGVVYGAGAGPEPLVPSSRHGHTRIPFPGQFPRSAKSGAIVSPKAAQLRRTAPPPMGNDQKGKKQGGEEEEGGEGEGPAWSSQRPRPPSNGDQQERERLAKYRPHDRLHDPKLPVTNALGSPPARHLGDGAGHENGHSHAARWVDASHLADNDHRESVGLPPLPDHRPPNPSNGFAAVPVPPRGPSIQQLKHRKDANGVCAWAKENTDATSARQACIAMGFVYDTMRDDRTQHVGTVLRAMREHGDCMDVLYAACFALQKMSFDVGMREVIGRSGGVQALLEALQRHKDDEMLHIGVNSALWGLCCKCSRNKTIVLETNALDLVLESMRAHSESAGVLKQACGMLRNLSTRREACVKLCESERGVSVIVEALVAHKNDTDLCEQACAALWGLCKHGEEAQAAVRRAGAIPALMGVLRDAQVDSPAVKHQAMGALRALGSAGDAERGTPPPAPKVRQLAAGLVVEDVEEGDGQPVSRGQKVVVHYVGKLAESGNEFDSSYSRQQPLEFELGAAQVIRGWDMGIVGMKPGGKRTLHVPSQLAYGSEQHGPIPAHADLVFEVELVSAR